MRLTYRFASWRSVLAGLMAVSLLVSSACDEEADVQPEEDAGEGGSTGGATRDAGDAAATSADAGHTHASGPLDAGDGAASAPDATSWGSGADAGDAAAGAQDAGGGHTDAAGNTTMPPPTCGGIAGLACEDGEFCDYALGDGCVVADAQGVCATLPEACDGDYTPVCGCDGETYSNACTAHSMRVSVAFEGKCKGKPTGGESCGPVTCGKGTVCCNALCGICTPPGMSCVQGCEDPDPDPGGVGDTCGGIGALRCGSEQFCNYEEGQGCDGTVIDAAGRCEARPTVCTREYRPVCSCDFTTYSNRCEAHTASASVLHEGACTSTECEALGGELHFSNGASIPSCAPGEEDHGPFVGPNGEMPIEPTRCCVPTN